MANNDLFPDEPIKGNPWLWMLKSSAVGWWKILNDFLVPAIFAVAGALIYAELDNILQNSPMSVKEMFEKLGGDVMSNPALFIALLILFALWVISKFRKDPTLSELQKINKKLDKLDVIDTKLDSLVSGVNQNEQPKQKNDEPNL